MYNALHDFFLNFCKVPPPPPLRIKVLSLQALATTHLENVQSKPVKRISEVADRVRGSRKMRAGGNEKGGRKGGTFCAGEARAAPTREDGGKGGRGVKGREAERKGGGVKGREGTGLPPVHPLISPAVVSGRSTVISVEVKRFRPAINMEKHRIFITSSKRMKKENNRGEIIRIRFNVPD